MAKSTNIIFFILGAGVGAAAGWYFTKDIYRKKADMEVESVRKAYYEQTRPEVIKMDDRKEGNADVSPSQDDELDAEFWKVYNAEQQAISYREILRTAHYNVNTQDDTNDNIYVIAPAEYGDKQDYSLYEYTYYADGVIANEQNEILDEDEIDKYIGRDAINHFGEYEDDSVYLRNENIRADIVLIKDLRKYNYATDEIPGFDNE